MPWGSLEDGSLLLVHNRVCADAAAEDLQSRTGMMRRMQQQEVLEEVRSREESMWRLELEGETEVPQTIIVSDAVNCTKVDFDGEGHHVKRMKEIPQRWKQPKGTDLTEIRKEAKMLRMDQCGAQRRST